MIVTGLIPARGGSKSIPKKNIKMYKNKPLIEWSIMHALESKYINNVIVSTDCEEIATIARKAGAIVPYLRPKDISEDTSTDFEFFLHYLKWLNLNDKKYPDIIVHLRPTYPNRKVEIIDKSIEVFLENINNYDSLRSVIPVDKTPYKMYTINNNILRPLFRELHGEVCEPYNMPRQILPKTFVHNGYIDITKPSTILELESVSGNKIYPFIMNDNDTHDIDTEKDWEKSEKS